MNATAAELSLGAAVVILAGVAIWAGPNLAVAVPSGVAAIIFALVLAVLGFVGEVRLPKGAEALGEFDSLVLLRQAFQKGILGRQAIVAAISGLESEILGPGRVPLTLDDEERLGRVPPAEFRRWVDARLDELERVS